MSELEIRLEQNRRDQQKLQEEESKLIEEIEKGKEVEWEFGDIALFNGWHGTKRRYLLYDNTGTLVWFAPESSSWPVNGSNHYTKQAKIYNYEKEGNLFSKK